MKVTTYWANSRMNSWMHKLTLATTCCGSGSVDRIVLPHVFRRFVRMRIRRGKTTIQSVEDVLHRIRSVVRAKQHGRFIIVELPYFVFLPVAAEAFDDGAVMATVQRRLHKPLLLRSHQDSN